MAQKPGTFGVFIRAPKSLVLSDASGLKQAESHVGRSEQFFVYTKSGHTEYWGDEYYYKYGRVSDQYSDPSANYPIFSQDITLSKTGERAPSTKETLMDLGINALLVGFVPAIIVSLLIMVAFLMFKRALDFVRVMNFISMYIALWIGVPLLFGILWFVFVMAFMVVLQALSSSMGYGASSFIYMLAPLVFLAFGFVLPVLLICVAAFLFKHKKFDKWAGYSKIEFIAVLVLMFFANLFVGPILSFFI